MLEDFIYAGGELKTGEASFVAPGIVPHSHSGGPRMSTQSLAATDMVSTIYKVQLEESYSDSVDVLDQR